MIDKKVFVFIGLLMSLFVPAITSAESPMVNISFFCDNVKINSSEIRVISKDGVKYFNLPFLIQYFHVGTDWNPDSGDLYFKFGKSNYTLREDAVDYTVDGISSKLSHAPFEADSQLWIPVEFLLKLGMTIVKEDTQSLHMDWADNYLLAMENTKYEGRPAFLLVGTKKMNIKSFLLTQPDRLVLDIIGFKAHPTFEVNYQNQLVKQIRFFQFQSDIFRIVFDLNQLAGWRIIPSPEYDNQVYIVFNYFVQEVNFFQKGNERKVYIKTSFPAKYEIKIFQEPRRLVIDFAGATLGCSNEPIPGDNRWIKSVRMSQYNRQTVRVVMDLMDSAPYFVIPSRQDPTLLEIRTVQNVTNLSWAETDQGGALTIEGDGELVETLRKLKNAQKLQIDLNYSRLAPQLKSPVIKSEQVRNIKLLQINKTTSRIEVDLGYYVGYKLRFSNDRRKLTVNFVKSPLIGKIVVLDPGHGGVDMGATGRQGTREKNINFDVAMRLRDLLEDSGARTVLTRTDDTFISLYERPFIANNLYADLFISIHTNFHPRSEVKGIEVFYYQGRDDSAQLAKAVIAKLVESTQLNNLGVKTNDFVVIREAQMPGILVELGFLSNFDEENTIRAEEFREKAADGIFQGIVDYYIMPKQE